MAGFAIVLLVLGGAGAAVSVSSASTEAGCKSGAAITGAGGGTCCAGAGERKNTINLSTGTAHHLEGINIYVFTKMPKID